MAKQVDIADAQKRALAWAQKPDGSLLARDSALGEEHLALDVLDLVDEVVDLRQAVEHATGPHCSSCGNSIDPEWCHCGEEISRHGAGDGHGPVPMGCVCGYGDPDWKALAKSRGEFMWKHRAEIARMRPVYEAAVAWAKEEDLDDFPALKAMRFTPSERVLVLAVMKALGMSVSEELIKVADKEEGLDG